LVLIGDQNRENRETIEPLRPRARDWRNPQIAEFASHPLMQVFMSHFDRGAFSQ